MSNLVQIDRWVRGIEYTTMSSFLADFRRHLEYESGQSIESIELNAALLLSDLCDFLALDAEQRHKVLGRQAMAYLDQFLKTPVDLRH